MSTFNYTLTFSSKVKYFDALYQYAAVLENAGYNALVPIDLFKYIGIVPTEKLASRHELSLLDIRKQKIDMSNGLFVYFDSEYDMIEFYKGSDTLKEIKYACSLNKDLYFSSIPKDMLCDKSYCEQIGYYLNIESSRNMRCSSLYNYCNDRRMALIAIQSSDELGISNQSFSDLIDNDRVYTTISFYKIEYSKEPFIN